MNDSNLQSFLSLTDREKTETLVRLSHELTIVARDTYEVGSAGLSRPARLRTLNEIQHRITAHVLALLTGDSERYPDDTLARIILAHDDDAELQRQLNDAFIRAVGHAAAV